MVILGYGTKAYLRNFKNIDSIICNCGHLQIWKICAIAYLRNTYHIHEAKNKKRLSAQYLLLVLVIDNVCIVFIYNIDKKCLDNTCQSG